MAAPNLLSLTTVTIYTAHLDVTNTPADLIAAVAANNVIKVEALYATNTHATVLGWISVWHRQGGVDRQLAREERVPLRSKVNVLIGGPLYLEEGDSLKVQANASSNVHAAAPYAKLT